MPYLLLVEFTSGSLEHVDAQDFESPLRDHLDRLRQLLGVREGD